MKEKKMKKMAIILGLGLLFASALCSAQETIETIYFDGIAPIALDGDLSDWDALNLQPIPITGVNPLSKPGRPRDAADLSASFRCVADNENVYVGVSVTDDILNFGEEPIGRPFFDDCVELLFYGDKTGISPLKIWVSADKSDRVTLDGREPVMNNPVIWQKHGVLATLSKTEKEYLIEVMIPNEVIGLTGWMKGAPVMMNVGVYDDDDGDDWDAILENTSINTNRWTNIIFDNHPLKNDNVDIEYTINIDENNIYDSLPIIQKIFILIEQKKYSEIAIIYKILIDDENDNSSQNLYKMAFILHKCNIQEKVFHEYFDLIGK